MALFYQHVDFTQEETMGKVTKLKYIDDISDDEMILFYFEDGTHCSEDFIAPIESHDPVQEQMAMVKLAGPNHVWVYQAREVNIAEGESVVTNEGQFEAVNPFAVSMVGSGANAQINGIKKGGTRYELMKWPRVPKKLVLEPEDNYRLSLHPELENGGKIQNAAPNETYITETSVQMNESAQQQSGAVDSFDAAYIEQQMEPQAVVKTKLVKTGTTNQPVAQTAVKRTQSPLSAPKQPTTPTGIQMGGDNMSVFIDADKCAAKGDTLGVTVRGHGNNVQMGWEEFIQRTQTNPEEILALKAEIAKLTAYIEELSANQVSEEQDVIDNEDILIKSMIEKSKTKKAKITMAITLELPPKEVYNTLKNVYEDGLTEQFVSSMTARIPKDTLLQSLNAGLARYYEGETAKKTDKKETSESSENSNK
jgi:hypothetical protein